MKFPFLIFSLLIVGCASRGPQEAAVSDYYRTVSFHSEPAGARIFVGYTAGDREPTAWDYLGTTPCTNRIPCSEDGYVLPPYEVKMFSKFVPPVAIFTAHLNGTTNRQVIRGDAAWRTADKVPSALFFAFPPHP